MSRLAGMAAGLALLAAGGGAWAQGADDKPVPTLSIPEVRALAIETGGVPGEVEQLDDNEYRLEILYPDGLYVHFEGWNCAGAGEARRCSEFMMYVLFELGSEAEARAKEQEISTVFLSDAVIGNSLRVWRMDYLDGMTRGRMRSVFENFLYAVGVARDIAFPAKEAGAGGKTAAKAR